MILLFKKRLTIQIVLVLIVGLFAEGHLFVTAGEGSYPLPMAVLLVILITAAAFDLYSRLIPLSLVLSSLPLGFVIVYFYEGGNEVTVHILGCILALLISVLILIAAKGQIGMGDLQLLVLTGFYTGFPLITSIMLLSFVFAGLFSVFLIIFRKSDKMKELPFVPFILAATAILTF